METRKTTITLPVDLWESLRVRAAEEHTTMSALIQEAVEAYRRQGFAPLRSARLEDFLHVSPEMARGWVIGVGEGPEDFSDEDID